MTNEEAIKILYEMERQTAYSGEFGWEAITKAICALRDNHWEPTDGEDSYIINREKEVNKLAADILEAFKMYRESCGIKDPVILDKIKNAYYEGYIIGYNYGHNN